MKNTLPFSPECVETELCKLCTSFISHPHGLYGMVWYMTFRVKQDLDELSSTRAVRRGVRTDLSCNGVGSERGEGRGGGSPQLDGSEEGRSRDVASRKMARPTHNPAAVLTPPASGVYGSSTVPENRPRTCGQAGRGGVCSVARQRRLLSRTLHMSGFSKCAPWPDREDYSAGLSTCLASLSVLRGPTEKTTQQDSPQVWLAVAECALWPDRKDHSAGLSTCLASLSVLCGPTESTAQQDSPHVWLSLSVLRGTTEKTTQQDSPHVWLVMAECAL